MSPPPAEKSKTTQLSLTSFFKGFAKAKQTGATQQVMPKATQQLAQTVTQQVPKELAMSKRKTFKSKSPVPYTPAAILEGADGQPLPLPRTLAKISPQAQLPQILSP